MIWPEAFIGDCYILLQNLFCTQFHSTGLWRGYCWGNHFLIYLFDILFFQLTGERKSLSKDSVQSQVPSLKVWCNFGTERVWSRNFWMKFPDLCYAEFIAWGISLDITFNQWESFNALLSALAAHGRCLVFDHDSKQWPPRWDPAVCSCWGGWQSLVPTSDLTGGTGNSRQEKSAVSSRYICFPVLIR